jgi:predicted secreted protein
MAESRHPPDSAERIQKLGGFQFAGSQHALAVAEQEHVKVVIEQFAQRSFKLRGIIGCSRRLVSGRSCGLSSVNSIKAYRAAVAIGTRPSHLRGSNHWTVALNVGKFRFLGSPLKLCAR